MRVTSPVGDTQVTVVDDGGCITVVDGRPGLGTAGAAGGCTISVRVTAPGRVGQVTTLSWPGLSFSSPSVTGPADFASTVIGNPWDYDQTMDARVDGLIGIRNDDAQVRTDLGVLEFGGPGSSGVTVPLLWFGFPGAVPIAPDGLVNPIDAGRYRYASLRLYSSEQTRFDLEWRRCTVDANANCIASPQAKGVASGDLAPGWQTVLIDLSSQPTWTGDIHNLYLTTGTGRTLVDHVRFSPDLSDQAISISAALDARLVWDRDVDPATTPIPHQRTGAWLREGGWIRTCSRPATTTSTI